VWEAQTGLGNIMMQEQVGQEGLKAGRAKAFQRLTVIGDVEIAQQLDYELRRHLTSLSYSCRCHLEI
jgi:hypothetical protein